MRKWLFFLLAAFAATPVAAWDRHDSYSYNDRSRTMGRYYDYQYVPRQSIFYSNGNTTYYESSEYVPVYRPYVRRHAHRYGHRSRQPAPSNLKRGDNSTRFLQPNHGWRQ